MSNKIRTTGDMREFLVNLMVGVKDGKVEADVARNATKIAAQVNESFYSEIKIAKIQMEAGSEAAKLGSLPINKSDDDAEAAA